jgi:polysaccharide pyruvyl transferase WcaK-like protein
MKKFMITGANFNNKGAQAMLFVTVSELRKRYSDCKIFFATGEELSTEDYLFDTIRYKYRLKKIALGGLIGIKELMTSVLMDFVKVMIRYPERKGGYFTLKKLLPQIDLIIDISGFSLGDKWNKHGQEEYLDNIRLARKYNVKMVLMPQSFGPFNYSSRMQILNTEIKELLQYPYVVFAREEEGERLLRKHYDLKNVRRSPDIVLQNKKIEYDKVFKNKPVLNIPDCISSNAVAIIPNTKCFQHGNKNDILDLYKKIVEVILENSMEVYLMRHSQGDLSVCRLIKEMFLENDNVQLLENDFSCIEFDEMIKEFQFTVVSRFHGAVHSYKNCVPCITLGWAVKYKELAAQLSQEKFSFDITRGVVNAGEILESVRKMIGCHHIESVKIEKCLKDIQQSNCFNILEEILNE